jgi:P-type E1-E2 ATPase
MVNLIKTGVPGVRTLSIGDGANDVAMIQEAHIGVGIKGEEGMQAVNASDYAIAQFRFLKTLLLYHGRNNYVRMSALIIYNFYKNIYMSMGQYWMNIVNGFSGQKYYTEIGIQLFNVPLTFLPILLYACYDMETTRKIH